MNGSNIAAIIITIILVILVVGFLMYCFVDQKQFIRYVKAVTI